MPVRAIASGMPYKIHFKKSILIPRLSNIPAAIAFGGVPIIVPIPPIVAASATPNNKALLIPDLPNEVNKGIRAATTIAVVAVFDISIEAIIVVNIKAISIFRGFVPDIFNVRLKSFSSNFVFVIAAAIKNPPSNNQMILLEKVFTYLSIFSGAELKFGLPNVKTK